MRVISPGETDDALPAFPWLDEAAIPKPLGRRGHLTVYAGGV